MDTVLRAGYVQARDDRFPRAWWRNSWRQRRLLPRGGRKRAAAGDGAGARISLHRPVRRAVLGVLRRARGAGTDRREPAVLHDAAGGVRDRAAQPAVGARTVPG